MRPRWRKIFHDLWDNKARTLLVVLSIAVGVFSIGVIAGAYQIISHDLGISYAANNPANVELRMTSFEEDIRSSIRNANGVKEVEVRRVMNFRVQTEDNPQWITIDLVAFESFSENKVNLLIPVEGPLEAKKDEILLEEDILEDMDISIGENLIFELGWFNQIIESGWLCKRCFHGCWRFSCRAVCIYSDGNSTNIEST